MRWRGCGEEDVGGSDVLLRTLSDTACHKNYRVWGKFFWIFMVKKGFFRFFFPLSSGLFFAFFLISCASRPKLGFFQEPKQLTQASHWILEGKLEKAREKINDYLSQNQSVEGFGRAYFLQGLVNEKLQNYKLAMESYRRSMDQSLFHDTETVSDSLYRLSFVYEKVGDWPLLLSSLFDLLEKKEFFDPWFEVETKARIAGLYISMGKWKEGVFFHKQAVQEFQWATKAKPLDLKSPKLGQTLYYLGLPLLSQDSKSFSDLLTRLRTGQEYFLYVGEFTSNPWAKKSIHQLFQQYEKAWQMIKDFNSLGDTKDTLVGKKKKQENQLIMASDLYDVLQTLKAHQLPPHPSPSSYLIKKLNSWAKKIENFAVNLDLGPHRRTQSPPQKPLLRYISRDSKKLKLRLKKTLKQIPK